MDYAIGLILSLALTGWVARDAARRGRSWYAWSRLAFFTSIRPRRTGRADRSETEHASGESRVETPRLITRVIGHEPRRRSVLHENRHT